MLTQAWPDSEGRFASYGGRFVPDDAVAPLLAVEQAWLELRASSQFWVDLLAQLTIVGRPTPIHDATRLAAAAERPVRILLKREDRLEGGSAALTHCIGQARVARHMGRSRVVCESASGLHGVAAAMACAQLDLPCTVFMGVDDMARQSHCVAEIEALGGRVEGAGHGLYDAARAAMSAITAEAFYMSRAGMGPHPYPLMTRDLGSIVGVEIKRQLERLFEGRAQVLPDAVIATPTEAPAAFCAFLADEGVRLIAVEGGGTDTEAPGENAAVLAHGRDGILLGTSTRVLVDAEGRPLPTLSLAAALDVPLAPPELAFLHSIHRVESDAVPDDQALMASQLLARTEGIAVSLEAAHAVAAALRIVPGLDDESVVVVVIGGRGDKDVERLRRLSSGDDSRHRG